MSQNKSISHYQNPEQSENHRRSTSSRLTPIACRVCDKLFFDNISLVLHFECHLEDEIPFPRQHGNGLASLQYGNNFPLSLSSFSFSSAERMNEACHLVLPRMNDCLRPCPLSVSSSITPNVTPRDVSLVHIPVMNPMPPINSSVDPRWSLSQPIRHSTMSHNSANSSAIHPSLYPHLGPRNLPYGSATLPPLQIGGQAQGRFFDYKHPQMKQLEKPVPELIVISDDEVEDDENADEIDLTLKL